MRLSELIGGSPLVHARATGLVGALLLASGALAGSVASRLVVRGDTATTAANFVASESLFRLGLASGLAMMISWLFYALLLHRLLRPVHRARAMIMVMLVVASVPIYMLNQVNQYAALVSAANRLSDQVKLFLDLHRLGNLIASVFFGLWLWPLGLLVLRSGFLPGWLGVLLMLGTPGYLVLFVQGFFFPGAERSLWSSPFLVVTHVSELALLLWLLVRGVSVEQWERRAREATEAWR